MNLLGNVKTPTQLETTPHQPTNTDQRVASVVKNLNRTPWAEIYVVNFRIYFDISFQFFVKITKVEL